MPFKGPEEIPRGQQKPPWRFQRPQRLPIGSRRGGQADSGKAVLIVNDQLIKHTPQPLGQNRGCQCLGVDSLCNINEDANKIFVGVCPPESGVTKLYRLVQT
eukprot:9491711-Pyramimonas_sp.AAC.1